jgi:hypothetical protein
MDIEFGETKASYDFFERHPKFYPAFRRLMDLGNRVFGRVSKPKDRLEDVGFGIGHTCREDYVQIVFLASNGYGNGASQIFRGLFERALTLTYLRNYPEKTLQFIHYAAIQEHRILDAALKSGFTEEQWDMAMTGNSAAEIRQRYQQYKPEFEITDCKKCQTRRVRPSWDRDIAAMVHDVGAPFTTMYLVGYAVPNLKIHATLASAMADFDKEQQQNLQERASRKRDDGELVLSLATIIFVHVMRLQNTLFTLGLDKELEECEQDVVEVWLPILPCA